MERFTVVIPTLDRCETLVHTLESCVVQEDENFRILVSDNHSTDATQDVVDGFRRRDSRVSCVSPPRKLGQARSWEFALEQVQDGFVMVLGSDDALLPRALERTRALLAEHPAIKAFSGYPGSTYYYPGTPGAAAGFLYTHFVPRMEVRRSQEWLDKVAQAECSVLELPMPYAQAWLHVSVLQETARRTDGRFMHSRVPSCYLGVLAAKLLDEFVVVSPGFCCAGISAGSIGLNVQTPDGNAGKAETFFSQADIEELDIPYHALVGDSRSEHMHAGEALLCAKDAGILGANYPIGWDRLLATAWRDFEMQPWSATDREANRASLRAIAENMGCADLLESAHSFSSLGTWIAQLPFPLRRPVDSFDLALDTRPLGITGVHEAARLVGQLAGFAAEPPESFAVADGSQLLQWCLRQGAAEARNLQERLYHAAAESSRRAGERDSAKARLAAARTKLGRLRAKVR